jgi:hypothetical protein
MIKLQTSVKARRTTQKCNLMLKILILKDFVLNNIQIVLIKRINHLLSQTLQKHYMEI